MSLSHVREIVSSFSGLVEQRESGTSKRKGRLGMHAALEEGSVLGESSLIKGMARSWLVPPLQICKYCGKTRVH